jgi:hypothetical protein
MKRKRGKKEGETITDTDLLSSWVNTGLMVKSVGVPQK